MDVEMDRIDSNSSTCKHYKRPTSSTSLLSPMTEQKLNAIEESSHGFAGTVACCLLVVTILCVAFLIYIVDSKDPKSLSSTFCLMVGVLNSLVGSLLSASGYCCQRWAHNKLRHYPELGNATSHPVYILGLLLLGIGTISAVLNLGLLGQTIQAPFAALTLIYNALLAHLVLGEVYTKHDLLASFLIVIGVALAVFGVEQTDLPTTEYNLDDVLHKYFFRSPFPILYTLFVVIFILIFHKQITRYSAEHTATGLFCFSISGGLIAGFTSLTVKTTLEIIKTSVKLNTDDTTKLSFYVLILFIPLCLLSQLYFMNKGLQYFGALKFVPLYQSFIILGNMICGIVYFDELKNYSSTSTTLFFFGCLTTIFGIVALLKKVKMDIETEALGGYTSIDELSVDNNKLDKLIDLNDITWASRNVEFLTDFGQCKETIVDLLSSATTCIYYSTFLCNFYQPLPLSNSKDISKETCTIFELLENAVSRGVEVNILYNPIGDYGTFDLTQLLETLPSQVNVHCAVSDLGPNWMTKHFSNNSRYAFHHQKYLCIDGEKLMVTGCDVNEERSSWLKLNGVGYYWHEIGVLTTCTSEMFEWIKANHERIQKSPPYPLVCGGWREENLMVEMIRGASYSIQLENQIFITGGVEQENRIGIALIDRIASAIKNKEDFYVIIITNESQKDEPSFLARSYCTISLDWSLKSLQMLSKQRNITQEQLDNHLVIATLQYNHKLVKVHSNLLIQDGIRCIRTSSNLADRSLSHLPCDTEFGLMVEGISVVKLQQSLFNMYFLSTGKKYSFKDAFDGTRKNLGITRHLIPGKRPYWFLKLLMKTFIEGSQGATGGKYLVHYKTTVAKSGYKCLFEQDIHEQAV